MVASPVYADAHATPSYGAPGGAPAYATPVAAPIVRVGERFDTLALSVGSRITVSTLMLACVLVICVGASAMLGSLRKMSSDVEVMNTQLAMTNQVGAALNATLAPLPPTSRNLKAIVVTIKKTGRQMMVSGAAVTKLAGTTKQINGSLAKIATNTGRMRTALQDVDSQATALGATVDNLNTRIAPLAATQHQTAVQVGQMRGGLEGMNASLAYVIRTLNYLTLPPTGGGFTVNVDVPKAALPPIPGIKAVAAPTEVFPRGAWPIYRGR